MAVGRPNILVNGGEQDWYRPDEFRAASIDPTARGENASIFGSNSVINPMSWGGMLSEKVEEPQILPADIQAYETGLQQTEATKNYYNAVDALNNLAVQARKSGFDINRPDPLNPNQRILNQEYLKKKREAAVIGTLAKQGAEVQKNLPKELIERNIEGLAPNEQFINRNTGFSDPSLLGGVRKSELDPEVVAHNAEVANKYKTTDQIDALVAKNKALKENYQRLADNAPNPNMRAHYLQQLKGINEISRETDYKPQELALDRAKFAHEKQKYAEGQAVENADANIVFNFMRQLKNGTFQGQRPNELGEHIFTVNPIRVDAEKQPKQEEYEEFGQTKYRTVEDPNNTMIGFVRDKDGNIFIQLQTGEGQPVNDYKLKELSARALGLGQKGVQGADKLAATRNAITTQGYDYDKIIGEEGASILKPIEDKYNNAVKDLVKTRNGIPQESITLIEDAVDKGIPFEKIPLGYGGSITLPIGYGGQSNAKALYDAKIKEKQLQDELIEAQSRITNDVRFNKSLSTKSTQNTVAPKQAKQNLVERKTKNGEIAIFDADTKQFIKYK